MRRSKLSLLEDSFWLQTIKPVGLIYSLPRPNPPGTKKKKRDKRSLARNEGLGEARSVSTIGVSKFLKLLARFKGPEDFASSDLGGYGAIKADAVAAIVDKNSRTRLNLPKLRKQIRAEGGNWYFLHKARVAEVDSRSHGRVSPSGKENLDVPIVIDREGLVIDGRHRVELARSRSMPELPAYVPAAYLYSQLSVREAIEPHRTAIARATASKPLQAALKKPDFVKFPALDWGCGRGADTKRLRQEGETFCYDPHYQPKKPTSKDFAYGQCVYVMNVIPTKAGRIATLREFVSYLAPGANVMVAARSPADIKHALKTVRSKERHNDGWLFRKSKNIQTFQVAVTKGMLAQYMRAAGIKVTQVYEKGISTIGFGTIQSTDDYIQDKGFDPAKLKPLQRTFLKLQKKSAER